MSVQTSAENSSYWDFLCGSHAASALGIETIDTDSLHRFDAWYFTFYPYLKQIIGSTVKESASVIEIGLGFGSVAEWLGRRQAAYVGVDIASAPVQLANLRLLNILQAKLIQSDVMVLPFQSDSFDAAVSIGALHHTGDFARALNEVVRVTKPGGQVVGMVYSIFSGRNFLIRPIKTLGLALRNMSTPVHIYGDKQLRALNDRDTDGMAPPSTEFFSRRALRRLLSQHGDAKIFSTNLGQLPLPVIGSKLRQVMIRSGLEKIFGLDLYFVLSIAKE